MPEVFISYSREDEKYRQELETQLTGLKLHSEEAVAWWSDTQLQAGSLWKNELLDALNSCRIALLLVSQNFLASNFIAEEELPRIFRRFEKDELKIFWVLLSPCPWKYTAISDYSAIGDPKRPLASMRDYTRQDIWANEVIPKIQEELIKRKSQHNSIQPSAIKAPRAHDPFWFKEKSIMLNSSLLLSWFNHYATTTPVVEPECISTLQHLAQQQYPQQHTIECQWDAPEPRLQVVKDTAKDGTKKQRIKPWSAFELLTARLYPRFRDAHLALLLHSRLVDHPGTELSQKADRYHVKRILRGLLRKQQDYNDELIKLSALRASQTDLDNFRDHYSALLLCHIAMLWAVEEQVFAKDNAKDERYHWLLLCTLLCERVCHWLLQAHSVARQTVQLHHAPSHLSATSLRIS